MKSGKGRIVMAVAAFVLLITAHIASGQALSVGCANTSASFLNGTFTSNSATFGAAFNAGEMLTLQISGAAPAVFQLSQAMALPLAVVTTAPVSGTITVSFTIPAAGFRLFEVAETAGGTITVSASCGLPAASGGGTLVVAAACPNLLDGRINNDALLDCGAPVAIYTGSVDIYSIDPATSRGYLVLRLTDDDLAAAAAPAANTLLAQAADPFTGQPISVYRLTTGELQVNAFYANGKPYTVAWPADQPSALYHLDW